MEAQSLKKPNLSAQRFGSVKFVEIDSPRWPLSDIVGIAVASMEWEQNSILFDLAINVGVQKDRALKLGDYFRFFLGGSGKDIPEFVNYRLILVACKITKNGTTDDPWG